VDLFWQRAEPHAHDLRDAGFEQDFYVEHSVWNGECLGESAAELAVGPPPPAGGLRRGNFRRSEPIFGDGRRGIEGFDVFAGRQRALGGESQAGTIAVVNIAEKSVVRTINANVRGANRLKFTPDGKLALVSSLNGADVAVLDVGLKEVVKRIPVGHGAAGINHRHILSGVHATNTRAPPAASDSRRAMSHRNPLHNFLQPTSSTATSAPFKLETSASFPSGVNFSVRSAHVCVNRANHTLLSYVHHSDRSCL